MASNPESPLWLPAAMLAAFIAGAGIAAIALPPDVAAAIPAPGRTEAMVLSVIDGDTLKVQAIDGRQMTVRLAEIDAPGLKETWGVQARDNLVRLTSGDRVSLQIGGMDRFGLTQAVVFAGTTNLNAEQVRTGNARVFRRYISDPRLSVLEQAARNAHVGVWLPPTAMHKDMVGSAANPSARSRRADAG